MKVLISGEAGLVGVMGGEPQLYYVSGERGAVSTEAVVADVFESCSDVRQLEVSTVDEALQIAKSAVRIDRVARLVFIATDESASSDERIAAAEAASRHVDRKFGDVLKEYMNGLRDGTLAANAAELLRIDAVRWSKVESFDVSALPEKQPAVLPRRSRQELVPKATEWEARVVDNPRADTALVQFLRAQESRGQEFAALAINLIDAPTDVSAFVLLKPSLRARSPAAIVAAMIVREYDRIESGYMLSPVLAAASVAATRIRQFQMDAIGRLQRSGANLFVVAGARDAPPAPLRAREMIIAREMSDILKKGGAPSGVRVFSISPQRRPELVGRPETDDRSIHLGRFGSPRAPLGDEQSGTVKFFNGARGFGFITPDGGGADVFVHVSAVERAGLSGLTEGQRVNFQTLSDSKKGAQVSNIIVPAKRD